MNRFPLSDVEERLVELVDKGEAVTITRDGVPVARLVPIPVRDQAGIGAAIAELKTFAKGNRLDGLSIRDLINEGRR